MISCAGGKGASEDLWAFVECSLSYEVFLAVKN